MTFLRKLTASTVGKKFLMSITGLALSLFLVGHLLGNLQLLVPDRGEDFNRYAHFLNSLGEILILSELALLAALAVHVVFALQTWNISRNARAQNYAMERTKGGDSKSNVSSRNMLLFGIMALIFICLHIAQFKYSLFYKEALPTARYKEGPEVNDLYYLVCLSFQNIGWVLTYTILIGGIGFHLRHGLWSMFQSIGLMPRAYSVPLYTAALVGAAALAVGFILLPWIIYFVPYFHDYVESVKTAAVHAAQAAPGVPAPTPAP